MLQPSADMRFGIAAFALIISSIIAVAAGLARRNLVLGRGDRRGALRIAWLTALATLLSWACHADHTWSPQQEIGLFARGAAQALLVGSIVWGLYLALEPLVRRRWPELLISWTRLLGGGFTDPVVARDLLRGLALGGVVALVSPLRSVVNRALGLMPGVPRWDRLDALLDSRHALANLLGQAIGAFGVSLGFVFLLLILRRAVRHEAIAALLFALLVGVPGALASGGTVAVSVAFGLVVASVFYGAMRLGLLVAVVTIMTASVLVDLPLTADLAHWSANLTWMVYAVVGAALLHALRCVRRETA